MNASLRVSSPATYAYATTTNNSFASTGIPSLLRWFFVLAMFVMGSVASAQTTLISPTAGGGFESTVPTASPEADFVANGWVLVNNANAGSDKFFIGTAAVPSAGTYSMFSGTSATSFVGQSPSVVNHFYKDVTFPAGETLITLTFKYKIASVDATFDYLKLWLIPTTTTPVAGTQLSTGQIGTTAGYDASTSYVTQTVTLPASAAGTTQRLVFSWRTDGAAPPAVLAIDEISLTSRVPVPANAAPINFVATAITPVAMNIAWTDFSTNEIGFNVYRSEDNITFTQVGTMVSSSTGVATGASYNQNQTGLLGSTNYYYRIYAVFEAESASFLPGQQLTQPGTIPLDPTNFAVSAVNYNSMTITYVDASTNETGFRIYRSTDNVTFTLVSSPTSTTGAGTGSTKTFAQTGLLPNTTYYFRIHAVAQNLSTPGLTGSQTTPLPIPGNAAPTTFTTTNVASGTMTLNWIDNSTNETSFKIFRSTDNITFVPATPASVTSSSTIPVGQAYSSNQTGLLANTLYYFRIYSFNEIESATYLEGSQSTIPTIAATCAGILSPASGTTNVSYAPQILTWAAVTAEPAITNYDVYFGTDQALVTASNIGVRVQTSNTLSYTTPVLSTSTTYYWKVVPRNATTTAAGCVVNSFITVPPSVPICPTTFVPTSGTDSVSTGATLTWSGAIGVPAITSYDLYIGTDFTAVSTLSPSVRVLTNTTLTSFTPSFATMLFNPGTEYFWIVVPKNSIGSSVGCSVNSFITYPPTAFTSTAAGGLWNNAATWVGGVLPAPNDNVTIADGAVVTVNTGITVNNLTIGTGGSGKAILQWSVTTAPTVVGNLNIASNGYLYAHSGTSSITLTVGGDFINNGYANLAASALQFHGSQLGGGNPSQTLGGTGIFQGDGTNGIIRALTFATGSASITTSQNLITSTLFHANGTLNTGGKLSVNNAAQVYGQPFNSQVANVVVTNMGVGYTIAPSVGPASSSNWAVAASVTVGSVRVNGNNVYVATVAGAATAPNAPVHNNGFSLDGTLKWQWVGNIGTIGTALATSSLTPTLGTQYFFGTRLFTCINATSAMTATALESAMATGGTLSTAVLGGQVSIGGSIFIYVGTAAQVTVNYDFGALNVRSLNVTHAGSGYYTAAPAFVFLPNNTGVTTTAVGSANFFQQIVAPAFSQVQKTPSATFSGGLNILSNQAVVAISATSGGVNLSIAPSIGFPLPTGFDNLIINGGTGYTSAPTVTVLAGAPLTGGTQPTFDVRVAQGRVVSVICLTGGSLWTSIPTLQFTGGGGSGATAAFPANSLATATATLTNGTVTNFTITNSGSGYSSAPTPGVVAAVAGVTNPSGLASRIGNYNVLYNFFAPATSNPEGVTGAEIPSNNRVNILTLGSTTNASSFAKVKLSAPIELYAATGAVGLQTGTSYGSVLNLNNHLLTFSHPGYVGTGTTGAATNSAFGYVTNGPIKMSTAGGGTTSANTTGHTRTFPFDAPIAINFGTGIGTTAGNTVTSVTVSQTGKPTSTGPKFAIGNRSYNAVVNSGAVYGTAPTFNLTYNLFDSLQATLQQQFLFVGQAAALNGPWTTRSTASGGTSILAIPTASRITATTGNGPAVPTGNDYFAFISEAPVPTITGAYGPYCSAGGQTVTITGTGFANVSTVTFNGIGAAAFTVDNSTTITAITPAGITDGVITVTANGTPGSSSAYVVSVTPVFTPTIIPSNALVCTAGGSVSIALNDIGADSYIWTGVGLDTYTGLNVVASPAATTEYTVSAVINASGCTVTKKFNVGVVPGASLVPTATPASSCFATGSTVTLNSNLSAGNFSVAPITYAALTPPSNATPLISNTVLNPNFVLGGSTVDGGWQGIPLGFNYNFFGNVYNQVAVSTNGLMMFGPVPSFGTSAGQLGQYTFNVTNGNVYPNFNNAGNVIAFLAHDFNVGLGGTVSFWTEGVAPSRKFVINFLESQSYGSGNVYGTPANFRNTVQCILYETTGVVEVHVTKASDGFGGFNDGTGTKKKTIGLQDATKTIGATAPGRQFFTDLITTPEAWRFSPPTNYTYSWSPADGLNNTTSGSVTYTPTSPGVKSVNLTVTNPVTGCVVNTPLTFTVNPTPVPPTVTGTLSVCGSGSTALFSSAPGAGNVIRWYDAPVGGTLLATGTLLVTPVINTSTTFYVAEESPTCKSVRTAVPVTITEPAELTVTKPVYCSNVTSTALTVTSNTSDYDTYVWTAIAPATSANLYQDAAMTIQYTGQNLSTVYVKNLVPGTFKYVLAAYSFETLCSNRDTATIKVQPAAAIISSPLTSCASGNVTLSLSSSVPAAVDYVQWQISTDGITFTDVPGADSTSYVATVSGLDYYRVQIKDGTGAICFTTPNYILTGISVVTLTPNQTVCNDGIAALTITSDLINYDTYTWAPAANLFTDAAGTIPYTAGTHATTVYARTSSAGSTVYTATATNTSTGCIGTATTTVVVLPSSVTVSATPSAICVSGTSVLSLVPSSGYGAAIYQWQMHDGTEFVDIALATSATYTTPTITIATQYRVVVKNSAGGECITTLPVTVQVNNPAVSSPVPASRCGAGPVTVSATPSAGAVIKWYAAATGGTSLFTGNSYTTNVTASTSFWAEASIGSCASTRVEVAVTVTAASSVSLSANQTVCNNGIAAITVTPTVPADYDTYTWTPAANLYTDAAATIAYVAGANATTVYAKTASAGNITYTVQASHSTGDCNTTATTVVTTLTAAATISASPSTICFTGTSTLSLIPASGYGDATFQWQSFDGSSFVNIGGATSATYTTPTVTSTTQYRAIINGCITTPGFTLTVDAPAVTSTTPGAVCGRGIVPLAASASAGATLKWYTALTGGTQVGTGPTFVTPIISTTTSYFVEASIGTCASSPRIEVIATINPTPAVTLTAPVTVCANVIVQLDVTSTLSNYNSYRWSPATNLYRDPAATIPYTAGTSSSTVYAKISAAGIHNYTVDAENTTTGCATQAATSVTIAGGAAITLTPNPTLCNNVVSALSVTSTLANYATYTWSPVTNLFTDAAGTIAYVAGTNASTVYVKRSTQGNITYTVTGDNPANLCSATAQVVVSIQPPSANISSTPATVCNSGNAVLSLVPATGYAANSIQWMVSTDNSPGSYTNIASATNPTYTTGAITASTWYQAIVKDGAGGTCFTAGPYQLLFNNPTVTPTVTSITRCGAGTATLNATSSVGSTINWYAASTGGTSLATGGTYITPVVTATTSYFVSATINGCESPRAEVVVNVATPPALIVTNPQIVCNNFITAFSVSSSLTDYTSYSWTPATNLYTDAAATIPYVAGTSATTVYARTAVAGSILYTINASNSSTNCFASTTTTHTVQPGAATISSTPAAVCLSGSAVLNLTPSSPYSPGTIQWQRSSDDINFVDIPAAIGTSFTTPVQATTRYYQAQIKNGLGELCFTTASYALVVNNPVVETVTPGSSCGVQSVALSATGSTGTTIRWYATPTSTTVLATGATFNTPVISVTTTYYVEASIGTCVSGRTAVIATITPAPTLSLTPAQFACNGGIVPISVTSTLGDFESYTWLPVTNLYSDAAGTIAYVAGTNASTVYFKRSTNGTSTYTVTATNATSDCINQATTTVQNVNVNITATTANPVEVCLGSSSVLTVTPATTYTYVWNPGGLTGNSVTVTPSALGTNTYTVTATDAVSGCTNTSTVNVEAVPGPTAPTAANSTQCGYGVPTAFMISNIPGSTDAFKWYSAATGGTLLQTGGSTYTSPINTTTTFYVSESNSECESSRTPLTVTVTQPDLVHAASDISSVCTGLSINLSVTKDAGPNVYSYTWSASPAAGSGIATTTTGANVTVTPTAPGTYVYTVIASENDCNTLSTVTVVVKPLPNILSVTAVPPTICAGTDVTLTALTTDAAPGFGAIGTQTTTIGGEDGNPYRSGNGTGNQIKSQFLIRASELISAGFTAGDITSLGFTTTGIGGTVINFTIKVAHTSAASLTTTFATPAMTTVFTQPSFTTVLGLNTHNFTTPFTWDGASNLLIETCQENSISGTNTVAAFAPGFNSNVHRAGTTTGCTDATGTVVTNRPIMRLGGQSGSVGAGTLNWVWTPGGMTGNTITVNPLATTTYTVTGTDPVSTCVNSGTVTVTVNPLPATPSATSSIQCGTQIPLASVSSNNGAGPHTFKWYNAITGGTAVQTGASTTFTSLVATTTTFYVAEVTAEGCESPRVEVVVTVDPPDPINATAATVSYCVGNSVTLNANHIPENNTYNYTWTASPEAGSGITGSTTGDGITVTPTASGTYIYTVVAFDPDKECSNVDTVHVTIIALPAVDSIRAVPATLCSGLPTVLNVYSGTISNGSATPPAGYLASSATSAADEDIIRVAFGTLNNVTTCSTTGLGTSVINMYSDFTGLPAPIVVAGTSVPLTVQVGTCGGNFGNWVNVFIDYNRDGIFQETERVFTNAASVTGPNTQTASIAIPADAAAGVTMMRVIVREGGSATSPATGTYTWGETEDYLIRIQNIVTQNATYNYTWNPGAASGFTYNVTPTVTTTYSVVLNDNVTGCSSAATPVTVTVNPLPAAPTATPSTQCGEGVPAASVTGNGGSFKWYSAQTGGTLLQAGGSSYTTSINTTTSFWVSESDGTCESIRTEVVATVTPVDPILASVDDNSVCPTAAIVLTATNTAGTPTQTYAYTWTATPATGSGIPTSVTGSSVTVNPTIAGTYVYTATGFDNVLGCTTHADVTVTVNANPVLDSVRSTPLAICSGSSATIKAYSAVVTSGPQTPPTGYPVSSATNPADEDILNVTFSSINNTSTCTTTGGPGSTVNLYSNYTSIPAPTVLTGTTIPVSVQVGTCGGNFGNWTNIYIDYNRNGAFEANEQAYTSSASTSGAHLETGNITIPATAAAGVTLMRVYVTEFGTAASSPSTTYSWGETEDYLINIQTIVDQNPDYTYTWTPGGMTGASVSVSPTTTTTYSVTALNPATGCSSAASPVTVTVSPVTANATATPSATCEGSEVVLHANPTGGVPFTFSWSDGTNIVGVSESVSVFPTTTTTYTVTVTDACGNPTTSQVTVNVNAAPTASINGTGVFILCSPATQVLTATTNALAPEYQWKLNGTDITGATSSTYTATASGSYAVTITELGTGCSKTSLPVTVVINAQPSPVVMTPVSTSVCAGSSVTLNAVSGQSANGTLGTQTGTIGGDNGNPYRSGNGTGNQIKTQLLVHASELTGMGFSAGSITSLGFTTTTTTGTVINFEIKMGHTAATALSATYETPSLTSVFTQASFTPVAGLNTHTFSAPFTWDGTSNVIIQVCQENSISGTSTVAVYNPGYIANVHTATSTTACSSATGTTVVNRPIMTFSANTASPITWSPAATLNTANGNTVIATPTTTTTYTATATNLEGCTQTNSVVVTVNPLPTVSFTGLSGTYCATSGNVTLTGSPAGGTFSGTGVTGNVFNPATAGVGNWPITYTYTDVNGCTNTSVQTAVVEATCPNTLITLNLKVLVQGYCQNVGTANPMDNFGSGGCLYVNGLSTNPLDADNITISLMNADDGTLLETQTGMLHTDGTVSVTFANAVSGDSYYIRVNHRNSIETWSAVPVEVGPVTTYDFTTSASQAYGDNMVQVSPGVWAMYSGDITDGTTVGTQDGAIESADYVQMETDVLSILFGYYHSDLTGDGIVESADYVLMETNVSRIIFVARPF